MKTKIILVLISVLLVFNIGFSAVSKGARKTRKVESVRQRVMNTYWKLKDISGEDVSGKGITLDFGKNEVSGKSGVNNYFGDYRIIKNKISISKLGVTSKAGSKELMELEADYLDILQSVEIIEVKGNKLILKNAAGDVLTFIQDKSHTLY
ncbi:META domain-containing protein [Leptotrichia sp. OH3620_COT-345]|uniref:META domain-containing protein n=1 Tax=Leptotrichia sp. OH3620_COT-345 TaxID=2491048 RepID=UPI000F653613|nr:META domain-containing protein [Leptotrichia sp. OH3620_COT-345]RRD39759.1 META domain-containing protein [Leptotrichia sp. OH3620_COT-345]